jgi:hypothetical protein
MTILVIETLPRLSNALHIALPSSYKQGQSKNAVFNWIALERNAVLFRL